MTLHLTLKMTAAQVVKTSVTNNSLFKDHPHPDDHAKQITFICELTLGNNTCQMLLVSNSFPALNN